MIIERIQEGICSHPQSGAQFTCIGYRRIPLPPEDPGEVGGVHVVDPAYLREVDELSSKAEGLRVGILNDDTLRSSHT